MAGKKTDATGKYHHGDMRKALTDAALEMAAESGVASLSLREIARRVGVSTAAPYFHFKDRQTLLIEIAIEGYSELFGQLEAAQKKGTGAEAQLELLAAAYLRFTKSHRAHYAIMFSGQFAGHDRFNEMVQIANKSLELVGTSIAGASGIDRKLAPKAAFCAWSLLHGIAMLDQNGVLSESAEEQEALGVRGVMSLTRGFAASRILRG
jgi:AcrR family transcriptional regulator